MLLNYFKIAVRNMRKNPAVSIINVLGLSAGLSFIWVIGFYIWGECRVNAAMPNADRLYIVRTKWKSPDMGLDWTGPAPLAKTLHENYPGLVTGYYHDDGINSIVSMGDKHFSEGLQPGDPSILTLFGFHLLYGDVRTALQHPTDVVITEEKALKYFGRKDVVGETLTIQTFSGRTQDFTVSGVLQEPPYNTVNYFNGGDESNGFFLPVTSLPFFGRDKLFDSWGNAFIINYVQLKQGVRPEDLKGAVAQILKQNLPSDLQRNLQVYFTPLRNFYMEANGGVAPKMMEALAVIAFFILLMAVINFVNMSIGNSISRLREIGVRKVMGSRKGQLVSQFLTESVLLVAFSVFLALLGYQLGLPYFSGLLGKPLPSLVSLPPAFWLVPLVLTLMIGLLSGLYPAFILSRQPSISSLKGKLQTLKEKHIFRYSLLAVQFVSAIAVFTSAFIIHQQVDFFFHSNLGYDKASVITATLPRDWSTSGVRHMEAVRDQFARMQPVEAATFSFEIPDGNSGNEGNLFYKASQDSTAAITGSMLMTDEKYAAAYHIPVVAGTFFHEGMGLPDSTQLVLNESAVRAMGWKRPEDAIGQILRLKGTPTLFTIGGVVKDFHFGSLHDPIGPLYFMHIRMALSYRYMSFRIRPGSPAAAIAALQKEWSALFPDAPFNYVFMDDTLGKMYATEIQMQKASQAATAVALAIVLLGVFGIVSLNLNKRAKEIGIRKVLGATIPQVIVLFIKEFLVLLGISNLIAWPLSYFFLHQWLAQYAYRINLTPLPFLAVGVILAALVALLIVIKTVRTASASPVQSLRAE